MEGEISACLAGDGPKHSSTRDNTCEISGKSTGQTPETWEAGFLIVNQRNPMNKSEILQEIQRTAAANDGVPLGSRRFAAETGIKEYDWKGKLWARWSDAVREAGFAPNQLQSAFDKAELLEKYAKLAQEIGRLPSAADLRLKHHRDASFPDQKVFERFGSKATLVQELFLHCQGQPSLEGIGRLCEEYAQARIRPTGDEARPDEYNFGFVYLIKSGRFYKIGRSNAVGRREYELAIQLPEQATKVHEIRTDDPNGIEAYWHKRFEGKRKNGEWFELGAGDIAAFKRRRFM